jgi:hypothetical protein
LLALVTMLLVNSGPIWIGVDALDPDVPPQLVERLETEAAHHLGLRQQQNEDLSIWRDRLVAIDTSFRQGNLQASRSAVERLINQLSSEQHPWLESIDMLSESLLMLGQIQLLLDDELGAAAAFQSHHALRPDSTPDASLYRPVVLRSYERLAVATLAGARRSLQVVARPAGATVWLDGKPRGQTPMTLTGLLPGRHYLRIVAGARSIQQVVDLGSEGRVVSADLGADAQTAGAFFSAWRERSGTERLQRAAAASGQGRVRFAVGISRTEKGFELHGVRFAQSGQVAGLISVPLAAADSDLQPLGNLLRSLRDGQASQPSQSQSAHAFGLPRSRLRPVVIGAIASGLVVAAASAAALSLWLRDDSGIAIDPGGLR